MTQPDPRLAAILEAEGFRDLRVIGGALCGVMDYLTTRAIVVGITGITYERRYCYQDRAEADAAFATYEDSTRHPGGNWIKVKGTYRGQHIDALNPAWPDRKPWDEVAPE